VGCLSRAVGHAEQSLQRASLRHQLGRQAGRLELSPRQLKVLERLIEAEPQGLTGDLTNRKYRSLTGASDTSASRDLRELLEKGLLSPTNARGRSTAYRLNPAGLAADARSVE
jgi:Fic family protein